MQLTVKQAAETYGLALSTIHRAICNGRLSASRQGRARVIDAAELVRVYEEPPVSAPETQQSGEAFVASELLQELRQLRQEVAALREELTQQKALPPAALEGGVDLDGAPGVAPPVDPLLIDNENSSFESRSETFLIYVFS